MSNFDYKSSRFHFLSALIRPHRLPLRYLCKRGDTHKLRVLLFFHPTHLGCFNENMEISLSWHGSLLNCTWMSSQEEKKETEGGAQKGEKSLIYPLKITFPLFFKITSRELREILSRSTLGEFCLCLLGKEAKRSLSFVPWNMRKSWRELSGKIRKYFYCVPSHINYWEVLFNCKFKFRN